MRRRITQGTSFLHRYAVALALVVALVIGSVIGINLLIAQKLSSVARVNLQLASAPSGGANYLLIGSDTRAFITNGTDRSAFGGQAANQGQRSDTMMILHVEPTAGKTVLVSVPRDLWVHIAGQGMAKINAAFNTGPQTVVNTIQADFGVAIHHYVEVNFDTFRKIVDAIGTVPVLFPAPARDAFSGLNIQVPRCYHLDGPAALSFVRSRDLQVFDAATNRWKNVDAVPDLGRVARQQAFLRQIAAVALSTALSNPLKANTMVDNVISELKLDNGFSRGDLFNLVGAFHTVDPNDPNRVQTTTLATKTGPTQQGQDVLYLKQPDADSVLARLRDFNGASTPTPTPGGGGGSNPSASSVRVHVLNASGVNGAAARALAALQRNGFAGAGTGNDPRGRIATTEIRYRSGADAAARLVSGYVPGATLIVDNNVTSADVNLVLGRSFTGVAAPARATATAAPTPATPTQAIPQPGSLAPVPGGC